MALLSLAWMQVALAGHQFDHDTAFTPDPCQLCVQLERSDDAAVPSNTATAVPVAVYQAEIGPIDAIYIRPAVAGFHSRAPPATLIQ